MSDVVLEIENLTRRFGAFTAVDALTLAAIPLTPTLLVFIGARLHPRLAT
jgi:ABC-type branched-subunit amino acid transport system ATPase component